ncbi:hypothetical protein RJ639_001925 [Escallonia herrerae]|uniref:peroxidase n=1 Tax=Escallonia herrerae TaxID=1293975 RepID=A0AA88XG02_9ASTE|nr:hypothetical protein RJ639_001925 [Escallonia herrerae]
MWAKRIKRSLEGLSRNIIDNSRAKMANAPYLINSNGEAFLNRPLKMTTAGFDPSPLCSTTTTAASYSTRKFSFPASIRPTLTLSQKKVKALAPFTAAATVTDDDSLTGESNMRITYGRRTLMLVSTMSYFLPLHKSMQVLGANAAEKILEAIRGVRAVLQALSIFNAWSWMFLALLDIRFAGSEFFLIQGEVRKVLSKGKAAGILRLVFHDAGTFTTDDNSGGMNGSIVYELDRPENGGLKKSVKASSLYLLYSCYFDLIIAKAKSGVDIIQPVSWADMIAVAGAEAVSLCGGPQIPVRLGRIDSLVPDPEGKLPEETLDASALKQSFRQKGFSTQELVALSGAHTLGNKGFGNPAAFDNSYFNILLERPWLSSAGMTSMIGLPSDRALVQDDDCLRWISKYANDQNLFFDDFKNAYIKLVNSGARWRKSL